MIHRADLAPHEIDGQLTSVEATLEHCLRRLLFDEARCVTDSARRAGVGRERAALAADARRYTAMVADGWIVVRLCYEDVMGDPRSVRDLLTEVVLQAQLLSKALAELARTA